MAEIPDNIKDVFKQVSEHQVRQVFVLCQKFGYGFVLHHTSALWEKQHGESAKVTGPCVGSTVPCECEMPHKCDWCCGSGWLTKFVKSLKDNASGVSGGEGEGGG